MIVKTRQNFMISRYSCHYLDKLVKIDRSGAICVNLNTNHFSIFQVFSSPNWSSHHHHHHHHHHLRPTSKMMSSSSSSVKSSSTSFKMILNLSTGMNPSPSLSNNLGEKIEVLKSHSFNPFQYIYRAVPNVVVNVLTL